MAAICLTRIMPDTMTTATPKSGSNVIINHHISSSPEITHSSDAAIPPAANSLTFKLAMQEKKKLERRPTSTYSKYAPCISSTQLDEYLGNQQERHLVRSSWKTLDMNYKWKYISEYLSAKESEVPNHIRKKLTAYVKDLLQHQKLNSVSYNNKTRKIESLGIRFNCQNNQNDDPVDLEL